MILAAACTALALSSAAAAPVFDARESSVVAAVLVAEAGGEGRVGMEAVAEVILNRSRSSRTSFFEVVTKPKQFSCLNGLTPDRLVGKWSAHPRFSLALEIVRRMTCDPDKLPRRTNGADHFSRRDEEPYWASGRAPVAVIGNHAFYRLDDRRPGRD
jgi:N-acetylmuramoyl-L-alanine amidase